MASGPPGSSWNPALMPDHDSPPPANEEAHTISSPAASPASLHNGTPLDPEPQPLDLDADQAPTEQTLSGAKAQQAQDDGGAWLESDQHATSEPSAEQLNDNTATLPSDSSPNKATEKTPSTTTAQHSSSMSFARTVSHELNFHDDDESDWNLSRTNTDPFKFMPLSERTNSFPVVPPLASGHSEQEDQPLPSNQALDVLEETERDSDSAFPELPAEEHDPDSLEVTSDPPRNRHRPSHSIGGEVQGLQEQESDARFEEGLPLIPHDDESGLAPKADVEGGDSNFFGEDEDNEDDFFASNGTDVTVPAAENEPEIRPLERKSTSQVLGAFDQDLLSPRNTLETTFEENESGDKPAAPENLDTKWEQAFGDDNDEGFLLDNSAGEAKEIVDTTAFLGSDDEGLLDDDLLDDDLLDDDEGVPSAPASVPAPVQSTNRPAPIQPPSRQASVVSPYVPQAGQFPSPALSGYVPSQPSPAQASPGQFYNPPPPAATTPFGVPNYGQAPPPAPPAATGPESTTRAQSFADKSKGGYSSPYDLPSDIVASVPKARRRPSTQSLRSPSVASQGPPPPPVRSASLYSPTIQAPPSASDSRPPSSHGAPISAPPAQKSSTPLLRSSSSGFFEELPMASKPRSASRHGARTSSPAPPPPGPPRVAPTADVQGGLAPAAPLKPAEATSQASGIPNLVAPEKTNPYAGLQSQPPSQPLPASNMARYSPAPTLQPGGGVVPPAAGSRYSPAPPAPRQTPGYSPTRAASAPSPVLPHLPRTSSPLAHFESSTGVTHAAGQVGEASPPKERRSSSSGFEPRLNRIPSLPPTREVDEEDDGSVAGVSLGITQESRYSPVPPAPRQTPPPQVISSVPLVTTPPTQSGSNYVPTAAQPGFVPPPRAPTQSPGGVTFAPATAEGSQPPSSTRSMSPVARKGPPPGVYGHSRTRGQSLHMSMVPPTDGREQDPLQRWRGAPVWTWGVGGTVVTTFPKSIPRYVMNSSVPTVSRVPGEIKVKHIKDIQPLSESVAKFPVPLKGKSKKKETIAWLTSGIETIQKELPEVSFQSQPSPEIKRQTEKLLLWKILRIFVEHDGTLEGTPAVEKAVREVLSPNVSASTENGASFSGSTGLGGPTNPSSLQADGADSATTDKIRTYLLQGNQENAVWAAVDKRLWGHALLIAGTVSPVLYKRVVQEFVRNEVNHGHTNESLGALYMVLSGNHDECVDELIPSHARAGLRLMSTDASTGPIKVADDSLDKWQETLALILSNRSTDDIRGVHALGNLLAGYGRAEAAHICFMFSRVVSVFGSLEDAATNFVLLGVDHRQHASHLSKDAEALQLSEVYEYGLSLAGATGGAPHLAVYKFHHAVTLAEYGHRDKALQYCDSILTAISAQTKRSPHYTPVFASIVEDFFNRLKQAPKEESNSWISKPNMNKVSDSMWNKFNKFVAGDDADKNGANGTAEADNSPFARIATTPTISRSPSINNFEAYGGGATPGFQGAIPQLPAAASTYAPVAAPLGGSANPYEPSSQYAPALQAAPPANDYPGYPGGNQEAAYPGAPVAQSNPYAPASNPVSNYQPAAYAEPQSQPSEPYSPSNPAGTSGYQPLGLSESAPQPQPEQPLSFGYGPPQVNVSAADPVDNHNTQESGSGGYEAPSFQPYGYEPPSYQPDLGTTEDDDAPKPKKSFMDGDDDYVPPPQEDRSKADKDRENNEMFRKAAEEDAKRAAEQQTAKKGWGFGGWFSKRAESPKPADLSNPNKPIRAKLGESSSFVYDPDLKRWVNKKPGAEQVEAKKATPPPPRAGGIRSASNTPPPSSSTPPPPRSVSGGPPPRSVPTPGPTPGLLTGGSNENHPVPGQGPPSRPASAAPPGGAPVTAPPTRPATSMSHASSIDDLIGAAAPRKPGQKKARKSGRYVDVMAKN